MKGLIFDIQKFSIHDGPGIRTTIFFKGCSLRCKWCHNPESIFPYKQLNHDMKKCILCGTCIKYVKNNGIKIENNELIIDFKKHNNNFELIKICPNNAFEIYGKEIEIDELIKIILKDKDYYDNSNGGVTFSGGEALNQIDFIKNLGKKLKEYDIHICLDFSGFDPNNLLEKTFNFTDIYLLDFKLKNSDKQLQYLEKNLNIDIILDKLEKNKKIVYLRCPIIPSVNDNEEHFNEIIKLLDKYSCIEKVDILPYHNLKKSKRFYPAIIKEDFRIPTNNDKKRWKEFLKKSKKRKIYLENTLI